MTSYAEIALVRGLSYLSEAQSAISHNLANVSSNGFKRRQPLAEPTSARFHSMLDAELPAVRYREEPNWKVGTLVPTGEMTHIALDSQDFFRVRGGDGATYFTRTGELHIDSQGYLTNAHGERYLDPAGNELPVRAANPDLVRYTIGPNGSLVDSPSGAPLGMNLGVFRVEKRESLLPLSGGRWVDTAGQDVTAVPTNAIRQGTIESSNVETVSEMVQMLVVQRSFQATSSMLRSVGQLQSSFISAMAR